MSKQPAPTKQPTTPQGHLFISAVIALIITVLVAIIQYLALRQLDWQTLAIVLGSIFLGSFVRVYTVFQNPSSPQAATTAQNDLLNFLSQQFADIFQRLREAETMANSHTHLAPSAPPVPPTPTTSTQPPPAPLSSFATRPWPASAVTSALDPQATQLRPVPPSGSGALSNPPATLQSMPMTQAQDRWAASMTNK